MAMDEGACTAPAAGEGDRMEDQNQLEDDVQEMECEYASADCVESVPDSVIETLNDPALAVSENDVRLVVSYWNRAVNGGETSFAYANDAGDRRGTACGDIADDDACTCLCSSICVGREYLSTCAHANVHACARTDS